MSRLGEIKPDALFMNVSARNEDIPLVLIGIINTSRVSRCTGRALPHGDI